MKVGLTMPDPETTPARLTAVITLLILGLGFVLVNSWPHPRGIYGVDYGWPMTLVTIGSAGHFDVLSLIVDLVVALDVLVLVGSILSPWIRKFAPLWISLLLIQLLIAGLIRVMFMFILRS